MAVESAATHVAFLRAINVRGHTKVAMQELTRAFTAAGCTDVQSIIQSGNVLFKPPGTSQTALNRVRLHVRRQLKSELVMLFRTLRDVEQLVRDDPFRACAKQRGLKLYVAFLAEAPHSRVVFPLRSPNERLEAIARRNREVFIVSGRKPSGFYGLPNNFIEKQLGVSATTRNWSTIAKIAEIARRSHDVKA